MKKGDLITPVSFPPIALPQLKAYGKAARDPNPIHWDEAIAKKAGLPGCIAHGMLISAFVANTAEKYLALKKGWSLTNFKTRFLGMTLLGDTVSVQGKVSNVTDQEITLDLKAVNQKGDLLATGEAKFGKN
ncbi:MaoC family dehydratase [bacterium]|jgi:acyl dehydratase|nr:MaoC family dehydratase [bacterium]